MHVVYFLEDLSKKSIKVFPVHISGMHNNNSNEGFIDMCLTTATTTLDIHNFAVLTTRENAQLISNVVGILFVSFSMLTVNFYANEMWHPAERAFTSDSPWSFMTVVYEKSF